MRYYVDDNGHYIGGADSLPLSVNGVPFPPDDARQIWNGSNYDPVSEADLNIEKDKRVDSELGGDNIRVLIEVVLQKIQDGSINTSTSDEVIALAKAKRRSEL